VRTHIHLACLLSLLAAALGPRAAQAAIPPDYKGTPFMGKPQVVPGRIELENFDDGGPGIGFQHHVGTAGSGQDYRPGGQPPICATNVISVDKMVDGGPYPQSGDPKSYYVCQCHAGEWLSLTIDVKQAGTYRVSSTFATNAATVEIDLAVNGVDKTGTVKAPGTNDYHVWKVYDGLTTIDFDAGLQVLRFTAVAAGLQQDYLLFELVSADGGASGGDSEAGAPSDASNEGGGASGSTAGAAGSGGATGGSGAGGASPAPPSQPDASAAGAGAPSAGGSGAGGATGGAGGATPPPGKASNGSGCAIGARGDRTSCWAALVVALALAGARRRRV
jgi:hypothetical protein